MLIYCKLDLASKLRARVLASAKPTATKQKKRLPVWPWGYFGVLAAQSWHAWCRHSWSSFPSKSAARLVALCACGADTLGWAIVRTTSEPPLEPPPHVFQGDLPTIRRCFLRSVTNSFFQLHFKLQLSFFIQNNNFGN